MPLKELAERRNLLHQKSDAQTILKHVLTDVELGKVALVSSFGAEAVVLLHMVSEIDKSTPVVFIETEMLFPETLAYQRDLSAKLGLTDTKVDSARSFRCLSEKTGKSRLTHLLVGPSKTWPITSSSTIYPVTHWYPKATHQ